MKKVLNISVNVLSWIVLIFALLITIIVFSSGKNNGVANLFGYIPMTVESDSMKPTFSQGDLIICREIDDVNALKENDVITFWTVINGQRVKNTHRIVEVNGDGTYVTRGDNNAVDDTDPAYASDLIGKWTNIKIPILGKIMNFVRTKTGFFICIVVPMAIFFLVELYKFIVTLIEAKRPEVPEIDEEEIKRRAIEEYLASQKEKEGSDGDKPQEPDKTENTAEETAAEETPAEEVKAEENAAEETPAEEAKAEETTAEETPAEEVKADENTPEEENKENNTDSEPTAENAETVTEESDTDNDADTPKDTASE